MRELEALNEPVERPAYSDVPAKKDTRPAKTEEAAATDDAPEAVSEPVETTAAETKPIKAAELRTAYEKSKTTIKEREAEIARLKKEIETALSTPVDDPEKKSLHEKFAVVEKRRAELEQQITFLDYQKSEEFSAKFQKPYEEAWSKAVTELSELTVETDDGTSRTATAQDLLTLSNMPLGEARKLANQMFGDAANDVMMHRRKIRELSDAQNAALADAQKNAAQRAMEQQQHAIQQRQKVATIWTDENKSWSDKFPNWFKPADGDEQGNALLAKGYEMADAAFSGNGKNPEEMVKLHAELRNKAAAFPRLALFLKRARTRIKQLESNLAAYEKSEPSTTVAPGRPRGVEPSSMIHDAYAELDTLDKRR